MRQTEISRKTKETDIKLSLCLEGGDISIDTGIGFFDHMLNSFATQALVLSLRLRAICMLTSIIQLRIRV